MGGTGRTGGIVATVVAVAGLIATIAAQAPAIKIELAHGTEREHRTRDTLERTLAIYDLKKYTFTKRVVIEERAINHAFPVLTLNVGFASSPDELLSSYLHEQLHWHLRDLDSRQRSAVAELRRWYPKVPVGLPASAENEYSTYGHLVDCYLEIQADRELLGPTRAAAVIAGKPYYTWIYSTILRDEDRIASIVNRYQLRVK
jgi:hypothetical protein